MSTRQIGHRGQVLNVSYICRNLYNKKIGDRNMENKKEPIKIRLSTVILIFIIFILIIAIVGILFYYNRKIINTNKDNEIQPSNDIVINGTETEKEKEKESSDSSTETKIEELDINSSEIQELYKYILKDNECIETIAYQNQKVTTNNLEDKAKIMTIFENIGDTEADSIEKETRDGEVLTHYYFKDSTIEKKAKQIFGDDVVIKHESLPNLLAKEIKHENGRYVKTYIQGGGGFLWEDSTEKLVKAEKKDDEIYLYDKYIHVVRDEDNYNLNKVYNASDRKKLLVSNVSMTSIDIDKIKNVNLFKHTFKKNTDGSYYWVSTELSE